MKKILSKQVILLVFILSLQSCEEEVTPPPPTPAPYEPADYSACVIPLTNTTLDIVTWNIENFSRSNTNMDEVVEIISSMDADIIGLQEIASITDFNSLVDSIDGWEGVIANLGGLNTGYLYKTSEISINSEIFTIYGDNSSAFPRPPVVGVFSHVSGTEFTIINLHLKCCGGIDNEDRRREASSLLKTYIDESLVHVPVLVVGDYNDLIDEPEVTNVFQVFINDSLNYQFTDMDIAKGNEGNWSYPGWPSHLDHILMTDELFSRWQSTSTILLDDCLSSYDAIVSDHRPVLARFNMN